jgi:hypothetical protein
MLLRSFKNLVQGVRKECVTMTKTKLAQKKGGKDGVGGKDIQPAAGMQDPTKPARIGSKRAKGGIMIQGRGPLRKEGFLILALGSTWSP